MKSFESWKTKTNGDMGADEATYQIIVFLAGVVVG